MAMKVSLVMTINNRTPDVCKRVADSFRLPGNLVDEAVIVLDRPNQEARDGVIAAWDGYPSPVNFVNIDGPQGWICPAKAWNAGYEAATGDLFYCISSEVVQDAGNVDKMRSLCADGRSIVFGACHNSVAESLVDGAEPGLLVSSKLHRPLGFIAGVPASSMRKVGGNDLDFMGGRWYEDDDLYLRLWQTGLDFVFDDSIHGIHQHHERPVLSTPDGQASIQRNAALMMRKHGTTQVWNALPRLTQYGPGRTTWRHL